MASRSYLVNFNKNGITIAIQRERLHILGMSGSISLTPVLLPGPRPESNAAGCQGAAYGFIVHISDHQHLFGVELLDDSCHQSFVVTLETFCNSWIESSAVVVCFVGHGDGMVRFFDY